MQQLKIQKIKCEAGVALNCKHEALPNDIIRLEWKKEGKKLDVCLECFAHIQGRQLKESHIPKQAIIDSGYYAEGAREVDFKSYYEKWIKQIKTNEL